MAGQWERWDSAFGAGEAPPTEVAREPPRRDGILRRVASRPRAARDGIPKAHRRAVTRAIRKGELLRDPEQARSVLRVTHGARRAGHTRRRRAAVLLRLGFASWLAVQAVLALRGQWGRGIPSVAVIVPLAWISIELWSLVQMRKAPARLAHADEIHRRYLHELGEPLSNVDTDDASATERERRLRWFFWLLLGLVAASVLLLWVAQR